MRLDGLVHVTHERERAPQGQVVARLELVDPSRFAFETESEGIVGAEAGTDLSVLSGQERRVLVHVAEGLTNKQVGEKLGLSENTVKNYLANVLEKLQVKRRAQAAAIFVQQNNPNRQ